MDLQFAGLIRPVWCCLPQSRALPEAAFVYLLVLIFLTAALVRRRGKAGDGRPDEGKSREPSLKRLLIGWNGFIALGLAGLTIASWSSH